MEKSLIDGFFGPDNLSQLKLLLEQASQLGFRRGEKNITKDTIAESRKALAGKLGQFLEREETRVLCKRHPKIKEFIIEQTVKAERYGQQKYLEAYHHALAIRQRLKSAYPTDLQNYLLEMDLGQRQRAISVYEQVYNQKFLEAVQSFFDYRPKGLWKFIPFAEPVQKIRRVQNALIGICSNRLGIDVGLVTAVEDSARSVVQFAKRNIIGKTVKVFKILVKYASSIAKRLLLPQRKIFTWNPIKVIDNCCHHLADSFAHSAGAMHNDLAKLFPRLAKLFEVIHLEAKKSLAQNSDLESRRVALAKAMRKQASDLLQHAASDIRDKHHERFKELLEDDRSESIAASLYVRISGSASNKRTRLDELSGTLRQLTSLKEEKQRVKDLFALHYAPIFGTKSLAESFDKFLSPQVADYFNACISDLPVRSEMVTAAMLDCLISGNESKLLTIIDEIECCGNPQSADYDSELLPAIRSRLKNRYHIDHLQISSEKTFNKLDPKLLVSLEELLKGNYLEAAYLRLSLTEPVTWRSPFHKLATFASPTYKRQQYQKLVEVFIETGPYNSKDLLTYYDTKKSKRGAKAEEGIFLKQLNKYANPNYALLVKELIKKSKLDDVSMLFHAVNGWTKDVDVIKSVLSDKSKAEIHKLSQQYSDRFLDKHGQPRSLEQDLKKNIDGYNLGDILRCFAGNDPKSLKQTHLEFVQVAQGEGITWFHRKLIHIPKALQILRSLFAKQDVSFYQQVIKDITAAETFYQTYLTGNQSSYPSHLLRRYELLTAVAMEGLKVLRKDRESLGSMVSNLASLSTGGSFAALVAFNPTLVAHPASLLASAFVFGSINAYARIFAGRKIKGRHYEWNDRWLDATIGYIEAPLFAFSQSLKGLQLLAQLSPSYSSMVRYVFPQVFKVAFKTKFLGYGKRVHFSRYSQDQPVFNSREDLFPRREAFEKLFSEDHAKKVKRYKTKLIRKLIRQQS